MIRQSLKVAAMLFSTILFCGTTPADIFASPEAPAYSVSVIDESQKGSVTIRKIASNSGVTFAGTGLPLSELPDGAMPLEGVTFRMIRLAELSQKTKDGVLNLYCKNLEGGYESLLTAKGIRHEAQMIDGEICYELTQINAAQKMLNENAEESVRDYLRRSGTSLEETDAEGIAVAGNLDQGLYLFAETEGPVSVVSPCSPFLLSLPMTNAATVTTQGKEYAAGTLWQYDLSVYPKSKTASVKTEILDTDGTALTSHHAQIGDVLTFRMTSDVPKLTPTVYDAAPVHRKYIVTGTLSSVFRYGNDLTAALGTNPEGAVPLTQGTEYSAEIEDGILTVTLSPAGLRKLDAVPEESRLYLTCTVLCGKETAVGVRSNTKEASLTYATNRTPDYLVKGEAARIHTYQIDMTKQLSEAADASRVSFEVTRDGEVLSFVREGDGLYHVAVGNEAEGSAVTAVSPEKNNGILSLRGMAASSYTFTELSTASGHSLLSDSITVTLQSEDPAQSHLTGATVLQNQTVTSVTDGLSEGHVRFIVRNVEGIGLPQTGGYGNGIYLAVGSLCLVLCALGITGILVKKKMNRRR